MGLEAVEIVMAAEEAFGITIADSEAEKMVTPHNMIEHIMSKVGQPGHTPCLKQRAFHRIRAALMRRLGVKRERIRLETRLRELIPRPGRRTQLTEFQKELGINNNIELIRPAWLTSILSGAVLAVSLVATTCFAGLNLYAWLAGFVIFIVFFGWLAATLTRGQRYEFQPSVATVEGLSRWVVANSSNLIEMPPGQWSREQVSEKVRTIVTDVLGCEKAYREDAEFVKDLGMG